MFQKSPAAASDLMLLVDGTSPLVGGSTAHPDREYMNGGMIFIDTAYDKSRTYFAKDGSRTIYNDDYYRNLPNYYNLEDLMAIQDDLDMLI